MQNIADSLTTGNFDIVIDACYDENNEDLAMVLLQPIALCRNAFKDETFDKARYYVKLIKTIIEREGGSVNMEEGKLFRTIKEVEYHSRLGR